MEYYQIALVLLGVIIFTATLEKLGMKWGIIPLFTTITICWIIGEKNNMLQIAGYQFIIIQYVIPFMFLIAGVMPLIKLRKKFRESKPRNRL